MSTCVDVGSFIESKTSVVQTLNGGFTSEVSDYLVVHTGPGREQSICSWCQTTSLSLLLCQPHLPASPFLLTYSPPLPHHPPSPLSPPLCLSLFFSTPPLPPPLSLVNKENKIQRVKPSQLSMLIKHQGGVLSGTEKDNLSRYTADPVQDSNNT